MALVTLLIIMGISAVLGGTWFAAKVLEDTFRDEP